jgi:hypothetical protein
MMLEVGFAWVPGVFFFGFGIDLGHRGQWGKCLVAGKVARKWVKCLVPGGFFLGLAVFQATVHSG